VSGQFQRDSEVASNPPPGNGDSIAQMVDAVKNGASKAEDWQSLNKGWERFFKVFKASSRTGVR